MAQLPDLNEPLTLKEACSHLGNRIKPATLRAARDRGQMEFERLGNKDFVTRLEIERWRAACRGKGKARDFTGEEPDGTQKSGLPTKLVGSSATDRVSSAQDSALAKANKLKKRLPPISSINTNLSESADVIQLPS
jgi:hypothetical protein